MSLLGIDLGSGSCKGVVFNERGDILGLASREYAPYYPAPNHAQMNSEAFWEAFVAVTRELAVYSVESMCISSHGETIIPVDKHGNAIHHAIMNIDNRAVLEAASWESQWVYGITGLPPHAMYGFNKIMWLKKHKPELYEETSCFLNPADYILERIGFPRCTDYSLASRVMALDIHEKQWSEEILDIASIKMDKLPKPEQSGNFLGNIIPSVARILNLKPGVAVVLGGHDQPCGALGAGATEHFQAYDSAGTYECLAVTSGKPYNTPEAFKYSFNTYCHVLKDKYITLAFFPAGVGTRWFVEQFCGDDKLRAKEAGLNLYTYLDDVIEALGNSPTGLCVTPNFVGACNPNWDANATGVMLGITPTITRHHVYKALHEGIACELFLNLCALETVVGTLPEIRISGGNAKSMFNVKLRADITGKRFLYQDDAEAVCRGAAMIAGTAAGMFKDIEQASRSLARPYMALEPDKNIGKAYEPQRERYTKLYPALRDIFQEVLP